jgi:predicted nuclease of predicted toxin-antitoxin system
LHALDLAEGNRTPDWRINQISMEERRVVVTKDADFVNSLMVSGMPHKRKQWGETLKIALLPLSAWPDH